MIYRPHLLPKLRSEALMQSAEGAPCTLRIASFYPGMSCSVGTTVWCHLGRIGQGMATKESDIQGAFGCDVCHRIIDGQDRKPFDYMLEKYPTAVIDRIMNGHFESLNLLLMAGLIQVPGSDLIGDPQMAWHGWQDWADFHQVRALS